jgi:hypothetical protein
MNAIFAVSRDVLGPPALKLVVVEGGLYRGVARCNHRYLKSLLYQNRLITVY